MCTPGGKPRAQGARGRLHVRHPCLPLLMSALCVLCRVPRMPKGHASTDVIHIMNAVILTCTLWGSPAGVNAHADTNGCGIGIVFIKGILAELRWQRLHTASFGLAAPSRLTLGQLPVCAFASHPPSVVILFLNVQGRHSLRACLAHYQHLLAAFIAR